MRRFPLVAVFLLLALTAPLMAAQRETVQFPAEDGLTVTADVYMESQNKNTPFLVLCHQARWSRGEYLRIAPWLNDLGYNCMAVDLRSGSTILGIPNKTAEDARETGESTEYCAAQTDIVAAAKYAREHFAKGELVLVGSSFSASLVLRIAAEAPSLADGVAAFSPGEYFHAEGKSADWTKQAAAQIKQCPVFIAWSKDENASWLDIAEAIPCTDTTIFIPPEKGQHGARALWEEFNMSDKYRKAFRTFLTRYFPPAEGEAAPVEGVDQVGEADPVEEEGEEAEKPE